MKFRYFLIIYFLIANFAGYSNSKKTNQKTKVPKKIKFGQLKLYLNNNVRNKIQKKVDSLVRWKFDKMIERANLYFPIFEQILEEENLPQDLKFLAMHESGLIHNQISYTDDYGIWAFQEETAKEVGMHVNPMIDERFNVISSTRGMAKYMKKNYKFFNNWIHTLLAYNRGKKGAKNLIKTHCNKYKKKYRGNCMLLGTNTPTYIIQFLAYKIAFQNHVGKAKHPKYTLKIHKAKAGSTLEEISKTHNTTLEIVSEYNKWLKCKKIPKHNNTYLMIVPVKHSDNMHYESQIEKKQHVVKYKNIIQKTINGVKSIIAYKDMTLFQLSQYCNISVKNLTANNEVSKNHILKKGIPYYIYPKKRNCKKKYYISKKGDTWWSIAQKHGIKTKYLIYKNKRNIKKINLNEYIKPGTKIWLKYIKPKTKNK